MVLRTIQTLWKTIFEKSENNKYLLWLLINVINVVQYSKIAVILLNTTNRINTQETDVISLHFALRVILNIQKNRNLTFKYLWFYKKIHAFSFLLRTTHSSRIISMLWKNCGKHNKTNKADVYLLKMNSKVKKIKNRKKNLILTFEMQKSLSLIIFVIHYFMWKNSSFVIYPTSPTSSIVKSSERTGKKQKDLHSFRCSCRAYN